MLLKLCFKNNYGWIFGPLYLNRVLMKQHNHLKSQSWNLGMERKVEEWKTALSFLSSATF